MPSFFNIYYFREKKSKSKTVRPPVDRSIVSEHIEQKTLER